MTRMPFGGTSAPESRKERETLMSVVLLSAQHATGELEVNWRVLGEWREGGESDGH